jgi:hypothetical protein
MSKTAPISPSLNGYALTNQFRKLRLRWVFTPLEAYLFFELVALCNDEGWPAEFSAKNSVLTGALGCSEKALVKCRVTLKKAGLIDFTEGQNRRPTAYRFCLTEGLPQVSVQAASPTPEPLPEVSLSDTKHLPEGLPQVRVAGADNGKHLPKGLPEVSPYIEQTKTKTKESKDAASAAVSGSSLGKASTPKRPTKKALDHAAVAALPLPHPSAEFADLWRTFYTENTHQQAKPVSSLALLLKKLGNWPEGAAIEVLEAAVGSNWSGFAHDGAKKIVDNWKPRPAATFPRSVDANAVLDPEAVAANHAAAQAAMRQRIAERQQRQAPA